MGAGSAERATDKKCLVGNCVEVPSLGGSREAGTQREEGREIGFGGPQRGAEWSHMKRPTSRQADNMHKGV